MKVPFLNDLHFGARNGREVFEVALEQFLEDQFFPYVDANNIKTVIIPGDVFEERSAIKVRHLSHAKERLFDKLEQRGILTLVSLGNHDLHYKNTLNPNSLKPILERYKFVKLIDTPTPLKVDKLELLILPWMCSENEAECLAAVNETKAQILVTHMNVKGATPFPGVVLNEGYDPDVFDKFYYVLNGHIHTRCVVKNVVCLGTQYQMNVGDRGVAKGFNVLDTETMQLEFIENPCTVYEKFYIDNDLVEGTKPSEWLARMAVKLTDKFVDFIVVNTKDSVINHMRDKLDGTCIADFIDGGIIEDVAAEEEAVFAVITSGGSSLDALKAAIDASESKLNKATLFQLAQQLHTEALNKGVTRD